jgi:hypothetical protein
MEYVKTDFLKEKPTVSGKYFTWNEIETVNGKKLDMQTTIFDLEKNKTWSANPVKYWLKPIESTNKD